MIEVKPGNPDTFTLKALTSITVTNTGGSAAVYFDGALLNATHTGTKVYGPFKATGKLKIVSTTTSTYYKTTSVRGNQETPLQQRNGTLDDASLAALQASGFNVGGLPSKNWKKDNTKNIRAAMAGAASIDNRSVFLVEGDSLNAGSGSDNQAGANLLNNIHKRRWTTLMASLLTKAGYQADADWYGGTASAANAAAIAAMDPRMSFTNTGGSILVGYNAIGSRMIGANGVGDAITFTPGRTFDRVMTLIGRGSALGTSSLTCSSDATVRTLTHTNGFNDLQLVTTSVTPGASSFTLSKATGNNWVALFGVRDSSKPGIEVINTAISGIDLNYFNLTPDSSVNAFCPRVGVPALFADYSNKVVFLDGWFNDRNAGKTLDQMLAIQAQRIQAHKDAGSDVVWIGYPILNPGSIGTDTFNTWYDALQNQAIQMFDIPVIDMRVVMYSYAYGVSMGWYADSLHVRAAGQALIAKSVVDAMLSV